MIKNEISIVIKPISSFYDFLPNNKSKEYLKILKTDYGKFIDKDHTIKPNDELSKFNFDNYIKDNGPSLNYILMPYMDSILIEAYRKTIKKEKFINYDYTKVNNTEYMMELIENHVRNIQSNNPRLPYIKITYHIPLYDNSQLEFRFKIKDTKTTIVQYKDVFNKQKLENINKLPFVTYLDIKLKIDESLEDIFLKKKKNNFILFLETLYKYSRSKQLREDYKLKLYFHKVVILYSSDFMEKDITKLNNDYYYELPTISIKDTYFSASEKDKDNFKDEYNQNTYKGSNNTYKCIGKLTYINKHRYKFSVKLKQLIFEENTEDTIVFYINIEQYLGIIHRYTIKTKNNYLNITNPIGNIMLFNDSDIKLFKYNNIDKSLGDNHELFIPKNYRLDKGSFEDFLNKKSTPSDFLKYFKSPTELDKYKQFLEENYEKLKYEHTLKNSKLENTYYFELWLNMLFEQNIQFHIKPRDSSTSSSDTQYRIKLDDSIIVYEIMEDDYYKDLLKNLIPNKGIKKKYRDIIYSIKPNYIVYVNLLFKKKDFKKSLYDCNEIRFKLIKHTKQLITGGKTKRKKLKYNKRNNKACITKRCLRQRYSLQEV